MSPFLNDWEFENSLLYRDFLKVDSTFLFVLVASQLYRRKKNKIKLPSSHKLLVLEVLILGSLWIDDFRTTPPLDHVIVLRCRPVEIWIYDSY